MSSPEAGVHDNSGAAYRGADRRTRSAPAAERSIRTPVLVISGLALAEVVVSRGLPTAPQFVVALERVDFAAGALMVVAGVEMLFRWKFDGRAFAWWVGLALVVLGVPGLTTANGGGRILSLSVASACVAAFLFHVSLRTPEVDSTLTVARAAIALPVAIGGTFAVSAGIAVVSNGAVVASALTAVVLGLLAVAYSRSLRGERWLAVVLLGLSFAALLPVLLQAEALEPPAAAILRLVTAVVAAFGAVVGLHASARAHSSVALQAQQQRALSDARATEVEARFFETLHEVRSTVVALEGGMRTLRPVSDDRDLSQESLARALVAELGRLRVLVEPKDPIEGSEFSVRDALQPQLTVSVAAGVPVTWNVPEDLHALGCAADIAQVTHAILTNARRYAPGSPIEVAASRQDDYVLVFVEDRGPGVPRGHRELIFERGERSDHAEDPDGHGLGLHIARRLARRHGGDLWVEPRRGGGARFVLSVPSARRPAESVPLDRRQRNVS